jgi:hypothetical protein
MHSLSKRVAIGAFVLHARHARAFAMALQTEALLVRLSESAALPGLRFGG